MPRSRALLLTMVATVSVVPVGGRAEATSAVPELRLCEADADLAIGSEGESVGCVQVVLGLAGLYDGRVTGVYDQVTADAVRFFQATDDTLPDNGVADSLTLTALGIWSGEMLEPPPPPCLADATLDVGESGADVECLQTTLDRLGMFVGEVDGVYGASTADAVRRYQQNNPPLTADGTAGSRTLAALGIWSGISEIVIPVTVTPTGTPSNPGAGPSTPAGAGPWPAPMMNLPEYRLTPDGIPAYGNRGVCSVAEANIIAEQFAKDGADIDTQQWAVYVASREGGCNYLTVNYNMQTRDDSHCTFQINVLSGTFGPTGELGRRGWTPDSIKASLQACADAASDLWVYCGRGPWMPPYYCRPPWQG